MTAARTKTCRVVSYNVHGCVGRDGRFRPDRVADLLEMIDAEFIGLQEVEDRRFGDASVSDYLAERLGMRAYRGPTLLRKHSPYGNLLLSRGQAMRHDTVDLSVRGREPRGAVLASFDAGRCSLGVAVTHLGLTGRERARQMDKLEPALAMDDSDVNLLLGDFNDWRPGSRVHRSLARLFGATARPRTFPSARPTLSLDRIYARPNDRLSAVHAFRGGDAARISDHLPVVATLALPA